MLKIRKRAESAEGAWVYIAHDGTDYLWWTEADREDGLIDREPDARLKVAPGPNQRSRQLLRALQQRYQRFRRKGQLPPEVEDKLLREVNARTLLLDWADIEIDGKTPPYTPELGIRAMEEDPDFENLVAQVALAIAGDHSEALEEEAEILGNASGGGSNTRASSKSRRGSRAASSED